MCVCVCVALESEGDGSWTSTVGEVSGRQADKTVFRRAADKTDSYCQSRLWHETARREHSRRRRTSGHQHHSLVHSPVRIIIIIIISIIIIIIIYFFICYSPITVGPLQMEKGDKGSTLTRMGVSG